MNEKHRRLVVHTVNKIEQNFCFSLLAIIVNATVMNDIGLL